MIISRLRPPGKSFLRDQLELTVREFFEKAFPPKNIQPRHAASTKSWEVIHLAVPQNKKLGSLQGAQQARLLLAPQALIQDPDILLLDETNQQFGQAGYDPSHGVY